MKLSNIIPYVLLIIAAIVIYNLWMSNDVEIKTTEVKKESLQKSLDSITAAQNDLGEKAKDTAKYFVNKGNQTIKKLHHEKPIVVLPSADSIDLYVSEYKFTE